MKVITLKKFKKVSYITFAVVMTAIVLGSIFPISVSLNQDTINNTIEGKLPLTIKKEIKNPLTKTQETITAKIEKNNLILDTEMFTTTSGIVFYKDKSVRFSVKTQGSDLYYDNEKFAFFYKPRDIDVKLNQEDLDKIFSIKKITVNEVDKSLKIDNTSEPKEKQSLFSKFKNKLNKYKTDEGAEVDTKVGSFSTSQNIINKYKNKAVNKYNDVVENGLKEKVEGMIISGVEWGTLKALQRIPVYKLKDKEIDNKAKLFLTGVEVGEGELSIQFSMANILNMSIGIILAIGLFFIFLEMLSSKVRKQERISFFDVFEVALDITVSTVEATGSVLEGVGEVGGGLLDI